jgi:dynein heavy chain
MFKKVHPDFRLFLTSMPAEYFPVPVLQNGVKLTNEPPKGLRANLKRSLAQMDSWSKWEEDCGIFPAAGAGHKQGDSRSAVWKKLAFGLCFFHAVIQERRKFGPLGFNIKYEFNDSDLETSLQVLKQFLLEQPVLPWDALRYVTGQINYGGRVTDDWDRRCLMTILQRFYAPPAIEDNAQFSGSGVYFCPPPSDLDVLKAYVDTLPLNDPPEVFGMHMNANITFQAQESDSMLKVALALQPRTTGAASAADGSEEEVKSPDMIVAELAADIAGRLPEQLSRSHAGPRTLVIREGGHMDSLATVLLQEMARFNTLLQVMSASLFELQRAIKGEVLMSDELDAMYAALLNNQVPQNWASAAYPSLKPLASWFVDLQARIRTLRSWLVDGPPRAYWLSGFFFPQGFMTGALQNHARKYRIPIDTLSFGFSVRNIDALSQVTPADVPEDGVLIYGLFLDGANWSKSEHSVVDASPGQIYCPMPIIHFIPTAHYKAPESTYAAPIYKTSVRAGTLSTTGMSTNFIVAVDLPTKDAYEKWIQAGVALLCQLND